MLRYLVVITIFSKLLSCQFFINQNKIKQIYKEIMKMLYQTVVLYIYIYIYFRLVNFVEPRFTISHTVFLG